MIVPLPEASRFNSRPSLWSRLIRGLEEPPNSQGAVAAAVATPAEAAALAGEQLTRAAGQETFIRTFAYPSAAAYGVLLDGWSPGWTRKLVPTDDLGDLVKAAAQIGDLVAPDTAAMRYGGAELRQAEQKRELQRAAVVKDLKRRFVDGPVLVIPRARKAVFITTGMMPIPEAGTIYPGYRTTTDWGELRRASVDVGRSIHDCRARARQHHRLGAHR